MPLWPLLGYAKSMFQSTVQKCVGVTMTRIIKKRFNNPLCMNLFEWILIENGLTIAIYLVKSY